MKRTAFFLAICLLLCSLLPISTCTVSADDNSDINTSDIKNESLSYYEYSRLYADQNAEVERLDVSAAQAISGEMREYIGETAVKVGAGSSAEWNINIPQDGLYQLNIRYASADGGNGQDYNIEIKIDGLLPFTGASNITLRRIWEDAGEIEQDGLGNDLTPELQEVYSWQEHSVTDDTGYSSEPCRWYFSQGEHTLTVSAGEYPFYIACVSLLPISEYKAYSDMLSEYKEQGFTVCDDVNLTYQAEKTYLKSSQNIFPIYDRNSAATVPNDPYVIKRNEIGGDYWKKSGDWISYKIEVPKSGLYSLTFKYRQNTQSDMCVYRSISVNGEIPFAELLNVRFHYASSWKNLTLADESGTPYYIFLKEGENFITLTASTGEWSSVLQAVDNTSKKLNQLYNRIIMVTGTTPDSYRDYQLENEIDGLKTTLEELSDELNKNADSFDEINGSKSSVSSTLRTAADQFAAFAKKPADIPKQLSAFRENITSLYDWLQSNKQQPLELDYFIIHGDSAEIPSANGTFWQRFVFALRRFFAAFGDDYYNSFESASGEKVISVWINDGRDQAQLWKDIITDDFTPEYGIGVDIDLVNIGITEAVLSGTAPDVMVGVSRGQPVNLASRNALYDISAFEDYTEVKARFADDAVLPYSYNDRVYALPMTQYFLMMFYRCDIFEELSLSVPNDWNEFMNAAAYLQRNNLKVGLPYTAITASGAVDLGVGAKDIFPTLLLQNGGRYYSDDLKSSQLDSDAALNAFRTWTSFYTDYGFDLSYDLVSLFRSGEMPLAIAGYTMHGMIEAVATEIHGNWKMALMPGTADEQGNINRAGSASGSAVIMMRDADDPEACWEFIKWITSADVQADFGNKLEGMLGVSARYATANLEAFKRLNWSSEEYALITEQRSFIVETPEIPGSYYTSRCIDNAFRNVVYERMNTRKAFEEQYEILETEIARKVRELEN